MEYSVIVREKAKIDKFWFFVVFLLGTISILIFDILNWPKSFSICVSGGLIVIYAASAMFVPGLRARPDQVADNSYYLGLLFTLVSLALALYRFASLELATDAILRNFGIAISSTIFGLALRVLISQFREDPEDLELEARTALAENVRRLRADLDQATAEMQRFFDGTRQALEETAVAATSSTAGAIRKAVTKFEKATDAVSESLNTAAASLDGKITEFGSSVTHITASVDNLDSRIGAMRTDPEMVELAVRPSVDELAQKLQRLGDDVEGQAGKLAQGMDTLNGLTAAIDAMGTASQGLTTSSAALESSTKSVELLSSSFEGLGTSVRGASEAFSAALDSSSASEMARAARAVDLVETTASTMATTATERLKDIDQAAATVRDTIARLNTEFSSSGQTVEQVRRELAEMAAWIIERLDQK